MDKRIENITKKLIESKNIDVEHNDLGEKNGFHEANEIKKNTEKFLEVSINNIKKYKDKIDEVYLLETFPTIETALNNLDKYTKEINRLVNEVTVNNPDFPQGRRNATTHLNQNLLDTKKNLKFIDLLIKFLEIEQVSTLGDSGKEVVKILEDAGKAKSEIDKMLTNLKSEHVVASAQIAAGGFNSRSTHHRDMSIYWFIAFTILSIITVCCVVYSIFFTVYDTSTFQTLISTIFQRLLLITTPAIFLKISLSKYNLERNLNIIYEHRQKVLNEYKVFDKSIEEGESKNQLRLEIAKVIFSDPNTGYVSTNNTSELNINPILDAVEKATISEGK